MSLLDYINKGSQVVQSAAQVFSAPVSNPVVQAVPQYANKAGHPVANGAGISAVGIALIYFVLSRARIIPKII